MPSAGAVFRDEKLKTSRAKNRPVGIAFLLVISYT